MNDCDKSHEQLVEELRRLRDRLAAMDPAAGSAQPAGGAMADTANPWRQLAQTVADVICMLERDGTILLINRPVAAAPRLEDYIGTSAYRWVPARHHDLLHNALEHVFQTGEGTAYEFAARDADGVARWWSSRFSPVKTAGRVTAAAVISVDITERKQAEEALRENEQRRRLVVNTARVAFVSMNSEGAIIDWNPQAEATFGWPRQEVIGRSLADTIIPERYRELHRQGLLRFL